MWHKPCRTFHPWCPCIKTRCLSSLNETFWIFIRIILDDDHVYKACMRHSASKSWRFCYRLYGTRNHYIYFGGAARWRHQMETSSALLAICAGNSPASGEFPAQRPVTRSFDVFFDLGLNKRLRTQSRGWWFETLSCPLWRHRNEVTS